MKTQKIAPPSTLKAAGARSPAYPFISLPRALQRAEEFKKAEGFYPVPPESAYKAWGFGAKSSGARQTLAALKHFGLLVYVGLGDSRKVRLSDLAKRILLDPRPDSPDKPNLIREAALKPAIHAELYTMYPEGLPSDTTLQAYLVLQREFNESGAKDLISEFRETADFASLFVNEQKSTVVERDDLAEIETGDLVNVEIDGVLQFERPKRVREVREHGGQLWVLTDGSDAWARYEQVVLQAKGLAVAPPPPPPLPAPSPLEAHIPKADIQEINLDAGSEIGKDNGPEWREERLIDDSGEEIVLKYKGAPNTARYEFIREYLDFKLARMKASSPG